MKALPVLVDLDAASVETLPCCGVINPAHRGRCEKLRWLRSQFRHGLRAKVLLDQTGRQCGYIEYVPGEFAWRGVDARGYMFIHCIWTFYKTNQHRGLGRRMIEACLADAAAAGMHGVAVLTRERPWLAGPALFLANGFERAATAPPDYQLLVRKLRADAPDPAFKAASGVKRYAKGLTIVRCNQCPHAAKFTEDIVRIAREEFGIAARIVELRSHREAQQAPTPYGVFAVIYNGSVVADHQVSGARFRNIMKRLTS